MRKGHEKADKTNAFVSFVLSASDKMTSVVGSPDYLSMPTNSISKIRAENGLILLPVSFAP